MNIRVLVVDDDRLARQAIVSYLGREPGIEVVGQCSSGIEALGVLDAEKVDVLMLDLHMPAMGGFDMLRELAGRAVRPRVLVLTSLADEATMMDAVAAGASGFLSKDASAAGFADAVRATHRGMTVLAKAPTMPRLVRLEASGPSAADFSERELDVLHLLCRGLSNKEIAGRLYLSESSVKGYASAVMAKLEAPTRLRAVVRAFQLGLAEEG